MGKDKKTSTSETSSTSTTTPSFAPGERESIEQMRGVERGVLDTLGPLFGAGSELGRLLAQGAELPGAFAGLYGGITDTMANELAGEGIRLVDPKLRAAGLDIAGGARQSILARTAGDIRRNVAQYNTDLLTNLLNMGLQAPGVVSSPILNLSSILAQRYAGLRPTTTTGQSYGTMTTIGPNPFLTSLQTGLGSGLGKGIAGGIGALGGSVFGPVGTAIGGQLGSALGGMVGGGAS